MKNKRIIFNREGNPRMVLISFMLAAVATCLIISFIIFSLSYTQLIIAAAVTFVLFDILMVLRINHEQRQLQNEIIKAEVEDVFKDRRAWENATHHLPQKAGNN